MAFTQNFNYCLEQKNYSAYRFAQIIGASNQGVLNWQSGKAIPYTKTRRKIADYFGITLAELDGDELPVLPSESEKIAHSAIDEVRYSGLTDKEKQVLTLFRQIPEPEWDNMLLAVEVALRSKGLLK